MSEREIKITAGEIAVFAALNDTATASLVWKALPIQASANLWGDEIRPASPVTVIGRMRGELEMLKCVPAGALVLIEPLSN